MVIKEPQTKENIKCWDIPEVSINHFFVQPIIRRQYVNECLPYKIKYEGTTDFILFLQR